MAQVVAAAYQHGKASGDYAAITKLTRVMLLAPMVKSVAVVDAIVAVVAVIAMSVVSAMKTVTLHQKWLPHQPAHLEVLL